MKKNVYTLLRILLTIISLLMLMGAWNDHPNQTYPLTINHPGKLELIYLGFEHNDHSKLIAKANGKKITVFKNVQAPSIQSVFLLEHTSIKQGETVLDIGTGSGIQSIFAAKNASRVVATDISDMAVKNAQYNAKLYGLDNKIEVIKSDLFKSIKPGETFDVILINLDYPRDYQSLGLWQLHERFFLEVNKYLKPNGRIYYQVGYLENIAHVQEMTSQNGLRIIRMHMEDAFQHQRKPILFEIQFRSKPTYTR